MANMVPLMRVINTARAQELIALARRNLPTGGELTLHRYEDGTWNLVAADHHGNERVVKSGLYATEAEFLNSRNLAKIEWSVHGIVAEERKRKSTRKRLRKKHLPKSNLLLDWEIL